MKEKNEGDSIKKLSVFDEEVKMDLKRLESYSMDKSL